MRPSTISRGQQLLRTSTHRKLANTAERAPLRLSSICVSCKLKLQQQPLPQRQPQKRWQSSTAYPSPTNSTESITASPHPKTHYDLFPQTLPHGSPPNGPFAIDNRQLRKEFLQLQAIAHPDRHTTTSNKVRAEATSAYINEAYKTLQSPLLRAQYLLSLRGIDVAGDETAKVADPELLMEVLEAREEIEGVEEEGELKKLRERNEERIRASEERLGRAFTEDDLVGAAREVVRLRYWVNIREAVDGWEKGKEVVLVH